MRDELVSLRGNGERVPQLQARNGKQRERDDCQQKAENAQRIPPQIPGHPHNESDWHQRCNRNEPCAVLHDASVSKNCYGLQTIRGEVGEGIAASLAGVERSSPSAYAVTIVSWQNPCSKSAD